MTFQITYQDTRDYLVKIERSRVVQLLVPVFPDLDVAAQPDRVLASLLNSAVKAGDPASLEVREAIHPYAEETDSELHNFRAAT
ncbi:hypothetical protein [Mycobacteroides abscessus]|uniref:hypothetical protein n=1 Tax=Mycobacteroides abscessus TaxID=36809 RepID=UPI000929C767|nr:hypothetical protein [Mycobacteroides abscessus]SHQ48739.1 Uncharacterised protein [Mycobacteroides abscessus subsp. abscessus]